MALALYYHPLASFCWKPLVALYENATPFRPHLVDLADSASRDSFLRVWPMGEFPVLEDGQRVVPQSSSIVEHLALHYPGRTALIPSNPEEALEARSWDRFYDAYVHVPMQKIVGDVLRPEDSKDPWGVAEARDILASSYEILDKHLLNRVWMTGESFTLADCSAAPALFYANEVRAFDPSQRSLTAYLGRLKERPSFARVLAEARPYFHMFPYKKLE